MSLRLASSPWTSTTMTASWSDIYVYLSSPPTPLATVFCSHVLAPPLLEVFFETSEADHLDNLPSLRPTFGNHPLTFVVAAIAVGDITSPNNDFIHFWPFFGQLPTQLCRLPPSLPLACCPQSILTSGGHNPTIVGNFRWRARRQSFDARLPVYASTMLVTVFAARTLVCQPVFVSVSSESSPTSWLSQLDSL